MEENSAHPRNPDLTQRKTAQACAGIVNSFVLWACLHHAQTFLYALQPLWMLMVIRSDWWILYGFAGHGARKWFHSSL